MLRMVARDGVVILDSKGNEPGRGGYIHPESRCLEKFATSKVKEFRSLKCRIDHAERLRITEAAKAMGLTG
jgi:predicted RNA-binding protein YlxR (DUF448 family)